MSANPVRIAGVDFGAVRIGIALADATIGIATPYATYVRRSEKLDAEYFRQLVEQERIARFVVGLPVHLSGRESENSRLARDFGAWLERVGDAPVEFFDERFTSSEAGDLLSAAGLTKKRRKARLDQLAAQIMLTAYLESGACSQETPDPLE